MMKDAKRPSHLWCMSQWRYPYQVTKKGNQRRTIVSHDDM